MLWRGRVRLGQFSLLLHRRRCSSLNFVPRSSALLQLLEAISISHTHLRPADFACVIPPDRRRERLELGFFGTNLAFLSLFSLEVVVSLFAFGPVSFLKSWLSCLDGVIVLATLALDVSLYASKSPAGHSA